MTLYDVDLMQIGTKLLMHKNDQELMLIYRGRDLPKEKFEKVLGLWALNSGSKWEDVIDKVGLSQLAEELRGKLSVPAPLQTGQDSSSQGDLSI